MPWARRARRQSRGLLEGLVGGIVGVISCLSHFPAPGCQTIGVPIPMAGASGRQRYCRRAEDHRRQLIGVFRRGTRTDWSGFFFFFFVGSVGRVLTVCCTVARTDLPQIRTPTGSVYLPCQAAARLSLSRKVQEEGKIPLFLLLRRSRLTIPLLVLNPKSFAHLAQYATLAPLSSPRFLPLLQKRRTLQIMSHANHRDKETRLDTRTERREYKVPQVSGSQSRHPFRVLVIRWVPWPVLTDLFRTVSAGPRSISLWDSQPIGGIFRDMVASKVAKLRRNSNVPADPPHQRSFS